MRRRLQLSMLPVCLSWVLAGCGGGSSAVPAPGPASPPPAPAVGTPSIASVTPSSIVAGSPAQTLEIVGSGFVPASIVDWNGAPLATVFVTGTELKATLPASDVAAGAVESITVVNPTSIGGASPASSYNVNSPTPVITGISPQSVPAGAAAVIAVSGSGFEANSVLQWNGSSRPTTFVNGTSLQVALTAADVQSFGTGTLTVNNPGPGGSTTTPVELAIAASTPTITALSPSSAVVSASAAPLQVVITGTGFSPNATAQANGHALVVTSLSATSMTVTLPSSYLAFTDAFPIVVTDPGPAPVQSNALVFSVVDQIASIAVQPNFAPMGSPDTQITVLGATSMQTP